MVKEDPVQEARAPERLFRVQMDWAQCCGKFKESQHGSDLHLKGQSGQRPLRTSSAGVEARSLYLTESLRTKFVLSFLWERLRFYLCSVWVKRRAPWPGMWLRSWVLEVYKMP